MLIAFLESTPESVARDVCFERGVFTAEGLGEVSVEDLKALEASRRLSWLNNDVRALVLGYGMDGCSSAPSAPIADTQMELAVETEVVYVAPHRRSIKTEVELQHIVDDMTERGWILVEDTRVGAAGGHLTFQRNEPLDPAHIAALSFAG